MNTKPFNWKIFWILLIACLIGVAAIFPYSLATQGVSLQDLSAKVSLPTILVLQVLQNVILFGVAILVGLAAANRSGLGLPILEAKLAGEPVADRVKSFLLPTILWGVLGSAIIIALDLWVFGPALKAELGSKAASLDLTQTQPAAWKGLLASFYGGINEEVLLRLGLMSILVWLGRFISKTADGRPTLAVLWTANILAAILFGLGHLPATAAILPITPLVVARAVVLNGLLGIGLGYFYWKYGLEAAITSHFAADIVLHVLLAL
jgi:hypothetical protein